MDKRTLRDELHEQEQFQTADKEVVEREITKRFSKHRYRLGGDFDGHDYSNQRHDPFVRTYRFER